MQILNLATNTAFSMAEIPTEVEDLRFCILDNSDPKNPDFYFVPMIFLECFSSPAVVIKIGESIIRMPLDWQILIGEVDQGDLEVVPLTSTNDRGFNAFTFNPITSFRPEFKPIEIIDVYQDVKWYFPKLRQGHLIAIPLEENVPSPLCAFFVKDISKQSEIVSFHKVW